MSRVPRSMIEMMPSPGVRALILMTLTVLGALFSSPRELGAQPTVSYAGDILGLTEEHLPELVEPCRAETVLPAGMEDVNIEVGSRLGTLRELEILACLYGGRMTGIDIVEDQADGIILFENRDRVPVSIAGCQSRGTGANRRLDCRGIGLFETEISKGYGAYALDLMLRSDDLVIGGEEYERNKIKEMIRDIGPVFSEARASGLPGARMDIVSDAEAISAMMEDRSRDDVLSYRILCARGMVDSAVLGLARPCVSNVDIALDGKRFGGFDPLENVYAAIGTIQSVNDPDLRFEQFFDGRRPDVTIMAVGLEDGQATLMSVERLPETKAESWLEKFVDR